MRPELRIVLVCTCLSIYDFAVANDEETPKLIADGHIWLMIDTGKQHTCGITTSNELMCWGNNDEWQVGDGGSSTWNDFEEPLHIATDMRFKHVNCGHTSSCAITLDDEVYCWGETKHGEIGNGLFGE